jgi:predicted Zn finger-like uncharacterized protein
MLIVCPTCASRYSIDDDKIGPEGRMVRCASCRSDFFARLPEAGTDDTPAAAKAGDMVPAPPAVPTSPPAPVAAPAPVKKPSADDDLAAASPAEAGLEPEPEPKPVPEPPVTTPSESASEGSSAKQDALDALFEQELAAARSEAEAAEASHPDLPELPPEDGSADNTDSKPGWRGWMARLLPGRRDRRAATGAQAGKQPHPSIQPKRRGAAKGSARGSARAGGGIVRLLKGPAGIGIASALILAALIVQRDAVVRLAPSSATLFAKLGLEVNINGLDFAEIRSTLHREGDQRFLVVEGQVISVDRRTVPVPLIEVRVSAADGSTLYSWTTEPPRTSLKPGEALHFRTRLATPPEAGRHVEVRFADQAVVARART